MKKQKKAVIASVLAASTLFTLTAVASAQNTAAYAELRDICVAYKQNPMYYTDSNYESTTTKTLTDENGNVIVNHSSDVRAANGNSYVYYITKNGEPVKEYGYTSSSYYINGDGNYNYYFEDKIVEYYPENAEPPYIQNEDMGPPAENEAMNKFYSVLADTIVPNDIKSLVKKTSDGTFTLELSKNQIPELAVLAFNAKDEQHDIMIDEYEKYDDGFYASLAPSIYDLNNPTIENVSFKLKGDESSIELFNIVILVSGTNDSGNTATNTIEIDAIRKTEGVANIVLPDQTGYTFIDSTQEFTGTAKFIKGDKTYEVTADEMTELYGGSEPYITYAYGFALEQTGVYNDPTYMGGMYDYFDTVIFTDTDGVEHIFQPK